MLWVQQFDLDTCFAPQLRALFRHLNFQQWSDHAVLCALSFRDVLRAIAIAIYLIIQLSSSLSSYLLFLLRENKLIYLSIQLLSYLSTYLDIQLSFYLPISLSNYLSIDLSTFLPVYISQYLLIYLSSYLPIDLSSYLSGYRAIQLSIWLSTFSTAQFQYVLQIWCVLCIMTSTCASWQTA